MVTPRLIMMRLSNSWLIALGNDVAALIRYVDIETVHDNDRRLRRFRVISRLRWLARRRRDEILAQEPCRVGVIVHREHHLRGLFIQASAPAEHLVEENRRLDVAEEREVIDAWHVYAGGNQVNSACDKEV